MSERGRGTGSVSNGEREGGNQTAAWKLELTGYPELGRQKENSLVWKPHGRSE
jgi:hypothetical protein